MKRILLVSFIFLTAGLFIAPAQAQFNPGIQPVIDYGNVPDSQILAAEASAQATALPYSYAWFTPVLQQQVVNDIGTTLSIFNTIINWPSGN